MHSILHILYFIPYFMSYAHIIIDLRIYAYVYVCACFCYLQLRTYISRYIVKRHLNIYKKKSALKTSVYRETNSISSSNFEIHVISLSYFHERLQFIIIATYVPLGLLERRWQIFN